ncbi:hypothetical protein OAV88_00970 [bacterium]|nr:hypothetical protein [bacterium]
MENLEGEASKLIMRGKARYIFEFKFELKCACTMIDPEVHATIRFPEVSSDEDNGIDQAPYEIVLENKYAEKELEDFARKCFNGLARLIRSCVKEFATEFSSGGKLQAKLIDHSKEVKVLDKIKTIEEKIDEFGQKIEDVDDDGEEVSKVDTSENGDDEDMDPENAARMKELEKMLSGDAKDVSPDDLKRLLRETKASLKEGDDEERKILEELESKLENLNEEEDGAKVDEKDGSKIDGEENGNNELKLQSSIEAMMGGMGGDIQVGELRKLIEETRSSLGDSDADKKELKELESKLAELEAEETKS